MKNQVHSKKLPLAIHPGTRAYNKLACLEQRYGVTSDQIREIIAIVGNSPERVDDYLRRKLFSFLAYTPN